MDENFHAVKKLETLRDRISAIKVFDPAFMRKSHVSRDTILT